MIYSSHLLFTRSEFKLGGLQLLDCFCQQLAQIEPVKRLAVVGQTKLPSLPRSLVTLCKLGSEPKHEP